jgi:hypothetical protein
MSVDEIKRSISFHGLTEGFQRNPLRHFIGTLRDYNVSIRDDRTYVVLSFEGINPEDIKDSIEPYIYPVTDIEISKKGTKKSYWGVLSDSAVKFLNVKATPPEDIADLIGKRLEMKMTGGHMMWNRDEGKETPRECWEIIGVEGSPTSSSTGTITATQRAIDLLDGKTEQQWLQEVYKDSIIKSDPEVLGRIANSTFLPLVESTGAIHKLPDGIWVK